MLIMVCVAVCIAGWAAPSASQPGRPGRGAANGSEHLAAAAERLDLLRMWRLIDKLEVREDQAARLFPMWSTHRRHRRDLQSERARLADQLAELLRDPSASESQLLKQMAEVEAMDRRLADTERAFRQELGQVLDARQRARLLLFPDQFRGELTEMVRGLRGMHPFGSMQGGRGWSRGRAPADD